MVNIAILLLFPVFLCSVARLSITFCFICLSDQRQSGFLLCWLRFSVLLVYSAHSLLGKDRLYIVRDQRPIMEIFQEESRHLTGVFTRNTVP